MADIKNYVEILKESLVKKQSVLQAMLEATKRQAIYIDEVDELDLDEFQQSIDEKDALLEELEQLDQGFEQVFGQIRIELKAQQANYKSEIDAIQNMIRICTDLGVEIERLEQQNKNKLVAKFSEQKREIRKIKTTNKAASTYYKTMSNTHNQDAYFMDQKK